ncbi:DUF4328 domain-containing protein (plasmid) [Streptomyces sp. BI20]|uniref:DUF4328 domain-containing protein n=1 Tax=Streptomyces sp. BI20 TaxID=3403460 RepID=UPI003C784569
MEDPAMSFGPPGPPGPPPPATPPPPPQHLHTHVRAHTDPHAAPPYVPGPPVPPPPGPPVPTPGPAPVLRSPLGLATALTVLFSLTAAVDLFSAGVGAYAGSVAQAMIDDPVHIDEVAAHTADTLTAITAALQLLCLIGTAAVFLVWFHRVRGNGQIFRPNAFTQSPGWAIGGWFIPFANLWLPLRTAREIWTASTRLDPTGTLVRTSTTPVTAWWSLWIASIFASRVSGTFHDRADTPEALQEAAYLGILTDLISVAGAVCALLFVRKLTAMQHTMATQGPHARP